MAKNEVTGREGDFQRGRLDTKYARISALKLVITMSSEKFIVAYDLKVASTCIPAYTMDPGVWEQYAESDNESMPEHMRMESTWFSLAYLADIPKSWVDDLIPEVVKAVILAYGHGGESLGRLFKYYSMPADFFYFRTARELIDAGWGDAGFDITSVDLGESLLYIAVFFNNPFNKAKVHLNSYGLISTEVEAEHIISCFASDYSEHVYVPIKVLFKKRQ